MLNGRREEVENKTVAPNNSERCFITLKSSEIKTKLAYIQNPYYDPEYCSRSDRYCDFFHDPINFLFEYDLLENHEIYMVCSEKVDAESSGAPPNGICDDPLLLVLNQYEWRLSLEFNTSLDTLKKTLNSLFSIYHGQKYYNPSMQQNVQQTLNLALVDTHIDIKNSETNAWGRVDCVKPKVEVKSERRCCVVM